MSGGATPGRVVRRAAIGVSAGTIVLVALWFTARVLDRGHVAELFTAGVVVLMVVTVASLLATRHLLSDLRRLRLVAVLLPGASVVAVELALYTLDVAGRINELAEHVLATSILGLGAVGVSAYLMRSFSKLGDQLNQRARRLQALHTSSMGLAAERDITALHTQIAKHAQMLEDADTCTLSESAAPNDVQTLPSHSLVGAMPAALKGNGNALGSLMVDLPLATAPALRIAVTRGAPFDDQDRLFLEMYAVAAAAALDAAHRLQDAQMIASVEERERIARDLHDELGQLLGFLTAMVQAIQELLARGDISRATHELSRLDSACRALGVQVREAILGLRTRVRAGQPLEATLGEFVADFGVLARLETSLDCEPAALSGLSAIVQYQLLQIVMEALSNVRKHAHGSRAAVRARRCDDTLELSIGDDGVGAAPGPTAGFGLKTMAERAQAIGGSMSFSSVRGSGTMVVVRVPHPGGAGAGDAGLAGR